MSSQRYPVNHPTLISWKPLIFYPTGMHLAPSKIQGVAPPPIVHRMLGVLLWDALGLQEQRAQNSAEKRIADEKSEQRPSGEQRKKKPQAGKREEDGERRQAVRGPTALIAH